MARSLGYRDYSTYLEEIFPYKVQKLAINAGFTCPNRDGSKGVGGCTYCNNQTFNPGYCVPHLSVSEQIEEGKAFFREKYPTMKYLAYFQAYTNSYGDIDRLMSLYKEAIACDDVVGLVIGTRPDCVPQQLLEKLARLDCYVMIEYGAESSHDATLNLINRCHGWDDTVDAVMRTSSLGIATGLHLILGLPGESREMMVQTVQHLSQLPVATVKFHQLQLIKGTRMARDVQQGIYDIPRFTAEEYIDLCIDLLQYLRDDIAVERFASQSPAELLLWPNWGLKNYQFTNLLINRLAQLDVCQGTLYKKSIEKSML